MRRAATSGAGASRDFFGRMRDESRHVATARRKAGRRCAIAVTGVDALVANPSPQPAAAGLARRAAPMALCGIPGRCQHALRLSSGHAGLLRRPGRRGRAGRDQHSRATRPARVRAVPHSRAGGAGHHLAARWARGDARGLGRRCVAVGSRAALQASGSRSRGEPLPSIRRATRVIGPRRRCSTSWSSSTIPHPASFTRWQAGPCPTTSRRS